MHPDSQLARQMAGNITLRHSGPWRIVLAGRRVWLEHQSGRRIIDKNSIVATLMQQFRLHQDLSEDVACGRVPDAATLARSNGPARDSGPHGASDGGSLVATAEGALRKWPKRLHGAEQVALLSFLSYGCHQDSGPDRQKCRNEVDQLYGMRVEHFAVQHT